MKSLKILFLFVTTVFSQPLYTHDCLLNGECLGTLSIPPYNEQITPPTTINCWGPNIDACSSIGYFCCVGMESDGKTVVNVCCSGDFWLEQEETQGIYYPLNVT